MKTNILRKRIVLGLLTSGLAISTLAGSVMAADEEIYDLGSSTIITSVQKEPERVEAIAPEAEPKHDIVSGGQVARSGNYGMLGNRDSLTTPFTVTSFTNQAIADTQAQTVNELIEMMHPQVIRLYQVPLRLGLYAVSVRPSKMFPLMAYMG